MNLLPDRKIKNGSDTGRKTTTLRMRTIEQVQYCLDQRIANTKGQIGTSSVTGSLSFTGTKSADEYSTMLRDGWPEGIEGADGLDGLSTDHSEKIQFVRSVGGAFPVVPAFLQGAPDAMLMPTPQPADSVRGLTLVIDSAFHCGIDSHEVLDYAQSVMKLVAWLAAEQIETAIYTTTVMGHGRGRYLYVVPIKEAGSILQPERIASIVHPSYFRRGIFALWEVEHYTHKLLGTDCVEACYGYPQTSTADELREALPEAYSVIKLPKVGQGDPLKAVQESATFKLKQGE